MMSKWPQASHYFTKVTFSNLCTPLPKKPSPIDPYCYEKREAYKVDIEAAQKNLEQASQQVQKVVNELTAAENNSKESTWSKLKSQTKLSLVLRLKNDYNEALGREDFAKKKVEAIENKYKPYLEMIEVHERREKMYAEFCEMER